jgi:hypothetical protein
MLARYKSWQLVVVGQHAKRKALGFFGHVTWLASGQHTTRIGRSQPPQAAKAK